METLFTSLLDQLSTIFNPATIGTQVAELLSGILIGAVVFFAFYLGWRLLDRIAVRILRRTGVDLTAMSFVRAVLKYTVLLFGLLNALNAIGVNTAAILASLGVAGLTLGFAARDVLSNIISGIFIFLDRPFVIGDLVEVEGHYGTVQEITVRSTRVITPNGRMLAVPNTTMVNAVVASYTNFPHIRLDISMTIDPHEDIDRVRKIYMDMIDGDDSFMHHPPPSLTVAEVGDYNITIDLSAWIEDERSHVSRRAALREMVYKRFIEEGVGMPLETIQLAPVEVHQRAA